MNDFDTILVDENIALEEMISTLSWVNFQIADLKKIKEKLEMKIIEKTGRAQFTVDDYSGQVCMSSIAKIGSHKHIIGKYKVTIKTDYNYTIKKDEYEIIKNHFKCDLNPVIVEKKYRVNLRALRDIEEYGDMEDKKLRDEIITQTPAKPSISVELNA